jgi:DNA-binding response OmpR family regulator
MKKILLVEDEIVLQEVYKLVLSTKGYDVSVANNGLEGMRALQEAVPDLILLDLFMPKMDGREFLRNFSRETYPKVKIIMCTNLSDRKTESEMLELGADAFVLKASLSPQDLTDLVARVLA